jgi:hypothetical protein
MLRTDVARRIAKVGHIAAKRSGYVSSSLIERGDYLRYRTVAPVVELATPRKCAHRDSRRGGRLGIHK